VHDGYDLIARIDPLLDSDSNDSNAPTRSRNHARTRSKPR
jgi:hypothetical protein